MTYPLPPNAPRKIRIINPASRSSYFSLSNNTARVTVSAYIGTVLPPAKPLMKSSWNASGRISARHVILWDTRISVVKQKSSQYRVTDRVTGTKSASWGVSARIDNVKTSRFRVFAKVPWFLTVRFSTLHSVVVRNWHLQSDSPSKITTGIVHPISYVQPSGILFPDYGLCRPVVYPLDTQEYAGYGQMVAGPGIAFRVDINPNGRVTCQKQVKFNDLGLVKKDQTAQWSVVHRASFSNRFLFNVYNEITDKLGSSWIVGQAVAGHIRQTAQSRTDFSY